MRVRRRLDATAGRRTTTGPSTPPRSMPRCALRRGKAANARVERRQRRPVRLVWLAVPLVMSRRAPRTMPSTSRRTRCASSRATARTTTQKPCPLAAAALAAAHAVLSRADEHALRRRQRRHPPGRARSLGSSRRGTSALPLATSTAWTGRRSGEGRLLYRQPVRCGRGAQPHDQGRLLRLRADGARSRARQHVLVWLAGGLGPQARAAG